MTLGAGGVVAIAAWMGAVAFVLATLGELPDPVASHFDGSGRPDGFMSRTGYACFVVGFAAVLPACVAGLFLFLPRRAPKLINVPHREHWLAPGRREATAAAFARFGFALGILLAGLAAGLHALTLGANARVPPGLDNAAFFVLLGGFAGGLVAWTVVFYRRFRKPGDAPRRGAAASPEPPGAE